VNSSIPDPTPSESTCPRCNATFTCGVMAESRFCWCFDLPYMLSGESLSFPGEVEKYSVCLCPACLHELMNNASI
jgi:hypothetical protein